MNYGWIGMTIIKKSTPNQQTEKTVKKVKLPNANKNHKQERQIFVQTLFSHSTFKIRVKKMHAEKQLVFFAPILVSA